MELDDSSTSDGVDIQQQQVVAAAAPPFVLKTYRMVNDPATDTVICWGRENNSFVVADPFAFSQTLLPAHFKHNNFSSFIRQLNTYGFRKVDPDRWEFAHASFLKGQTHLLRQIIRRSSSSNTSTKTNRSSTTSIKNTVEDEVDDGIVLEVLKLKQEQKLIDDKVEGMWRRLHETERKPKQMLAFLVKIVGDPQVLQRLMVRANYGDEEDDRGVSKRARLRLGELRDEGVDMLSLDCEDLVVGEGGGEAGEGGSFLASEYADQFDLAIGRLGQYSSEEDLGGLEMFAGDVF